MADTHSRAHVQSLALPVVLARLTQRESRILIEANVLNGEESICAPAASSGVSSSLTSFPLLGAPLTLRHSINRQSPIHSSLGDGDGRLHGEALLRRSLLAILLGGHGLGTLGVVHLIRFRGGVEVRDGEDEADSASSKGMV